MVLSVISAVGDSAVGDSAVGLCAMALVAVAGGGAPLPGDLGLRGNTTVFQRIGFKEKSAGNIHRFYRQIYHLNVHTLWYFVDIS